MKRLFLGSLMSCLLVGQVSADYKDALAGGSFTAGCALLGRTIGRYTVPKKPIIAGLCGGVAGLLVSCAVTWALVKRFESTVPRANTADAAEGTPAKSSAAQHVDAFAKGALATGAVLMAMQVAVNLAQQELWGEFDPITPVTR